MKNKWIIVLVMLLSIVIGINLAIFCFQDYIKQVIKKDIIKGSYSNVYKVRYIVDKYKLQSR